LSASVELTLRTTLTTDEHRFKPRKGGELINQLSMFYLCSTVFNCVYLWFIASAAKNRWQRENETSSMASLRAVGVGMQSDL